MLSHVKTNRTCLYLRIFARATFTLNQCSLSIVGAHGGGNGHLVLVLVALSFCKLQTFLNSIAEGNLLKSVYSENCIYIHAYVVS